MDVSFGNVRKEWEHVFSDSSILLCVLGFDEYLKQLSLEWELVNGNSQENLLNISLLDIIHPKDQPQTRSQFKKLLKGEPLSSFENRLQYKDGLYQWLAWNAVPCVDQQLIYVIAQETTHVQK